MTNDDSIVVRRLVATSLLATWHLGLNDDERQVVCRLEPRCRRRRRGTSYATSIVIVLIGVVGAVWRPRVVLHRGAVGLLWLSSL